jgi:hypothetical protein
MEKNEKVKSDIFRGAGVLLVLVIGSVAGIIVTIITGITGIIGAVAGAVAMPAGLFLESRFQGEQRMQKRKMPAFYIFFILSGIVLFLIFFF